MASSKKLTCKGTLRQVFICLRPRTLYHPPYTLYTCIQYTFSHREGGESWTREKVRGPTVHKAGSKIQTWLTLSPVYKLFFVCLFYIFYNINTFIQTQYINPSQFAEASLHILIACVLSGGNFPVVLSRESNSGLPYSKPTRCCKAVYKLW